MHKREKGALAINVNRRNLLKIGLGATAGAAFFPKDLFAATGDVILPVYANKTFLAYENKLRYGVFPAISVTDGTALARAQFVDASVVPTIDNIRKDLYKTMHIRVNPIYNGDVWIRFLVQGQDPNELNPNTQIFFRQTVPEDGMLNVDLVSLRANPLYANLQKNSIVQVSFHFGYYVSSVTSQAELIAGPLQKDKTGVPIGDFIYAPVMDVSFSSDPVKDTTFALGAALSGLPSNPSPQTKVVDVPSGGTAQINLFYIDCSSAPLPVKGGEVLKLTLTKRDTLPYLGRVMQITLLTPIEVAGCKAIDFNPWTNGNVVALASMNNDGTLFIPLADLNPTMLAKLKSGIAYIKILSKYSPSWDVTSTGQPLWLGGPCSPDLANCALLNPPNATSIFGRAARQTVQSYAVPSGAIVLRGKTLSVNPRQLGGTDWRLVNISGEVVSGGHFDSFKTIDVAPGAYILAGSKGVISVSVSGAGTRTGFIYSK